MAMNEYITNDGYRLLQRMLMGECIIDFVRIEMGNGNTSETDLRKVKGLTNVIVSLVVDSVIKQEDNTISISALFNNKDLIEGFYFREKGVIASDGEKEILFSYANAGNTANYINPPTIELIEKKIITHCTQCQKTTEPINIVIKSGLYATDFDLRKHVSDINPHGITPLDLGLDEVDNTSDLNKPVSIPVQEALDAYYAQLTAYSDKAIADLINGAPTTLDTLKELADAIKKNQDVQVALDAAIGTKAAKAEFDTHTTTVASKTVSGHVKVDDALSASSTNPVQNKVIKAALDGKLTGTSDLKDNTVSFTQVDTRINITTKEKLSVMLGKISKYFADLKTVAFTGKYTDLINKPTANRVVLSYVSSTKLKGSITVSNTMDWYMVTMDAVDGTPWEQVNNIACKVTNDRKTLEIFANGSGFVNGHSLQVKVLIMVSD